MKNKVTLTVLVIGLLLFSFCVTQAEEPEKKSGDFFVPAYATGMNYTCNVKAEGVLRVDMQLWRTSGKDYSWDYFLDTSYRHQTIGSSDDGKLISATQTYNTVDYSANQADKEVETEINIDDKKLFIKERTVTPIAPDKLGLAIIRLDYGDPFEQLLPEKPIRQDLEWSPDGGAIQGILMRLTGLQPPRKQPEMPGGNDGRGPGGGDPPRREMEDGGEAPQGPPPGMGGGGISFTSLTARVTEFKIDYFAAVVDFEGNLTIPGLGRMSVQIPIQGTAEFSYDLVNKNLLSGSLEVSGNFSGKVGGGRWSTDAKIDYRVSMNLDRKIGQTLTAAANMDQPSRVWPSLGEGSQTPITYTNGNGIFIAANWDGTNNFEILNLGIPIKGLNEFPDCVTVSSDGQCMVIQSGKKLFLSTNGGDVFKPLPWRKNNAVSVCFMNSASSDLLVGTDKNDYYTANLSEKKFKPKKVSSPIIGKPTHASFPGGKAHTLFQAAEGKLFCVNGDSRPASLGDVPSEETGQFFPYTEGVLFYTDKLYVATSASLSEVALQGLEKKPVAFAADKSRIFCVTEDGNLFSFGIAGGSATKVAEGVTSVSIKGKYVVIASKTGVRIK